MAFLSVAEATTRFPLSGGHIRRLLARGAVKGRKVGPVWAVDEQSLRRYLAPMTLLSVSRAASRYPLSPGGIRRLLVSGVVKGRKVGPVWAVDEQSLRRHVAKERKRRPKPRRRRRRVRAA